MLQIAVCEDEQG